jgi:hypothetical protein
MFEKRERPIPTAGTGAGGEARKFELPKLTRAEIDAKLRVSGDYVKIDFLSQCLKKPMDQETKKYALVTLSKIYEERKMLAEAGKMMKNASDINTTFQGKMSDLIKATDLFIRAGTYDIADSTMAAAIGLGNEVEKRTIKEKIKDTYIKLGREFLQRDKRKNAMEVFEKVLGTFQMVPQEKAEVQKLLLDIYQRLGKVKEYMALRNQV